MRTFLRLPDQPGVRQVLLDASHSDDGYFHPDAQIWLHSCIFRTLELQSNTTLAHPRLLTLILMTGWCSVKLIVSYMSMLSLTLSEMLSQV